MKRKMKNNGLALFDYIDLAYSEEAKLGGYKGLWQLDISSIFYFASMMILFGVFLPLTLSDADGLWTLYVGTMSIVVCLLYIGKN